MKIAILGAGNMGRALGKRALESGHHVTFGVRDVAKAKQADLGAADVTTIADAVASAPVVVLSIPFAALGDLAPLRDAFRGKIVIDTINPLTPDYSGLTVGHTSSAGEAVAAALPGAKVVKAFNAIFATVVNRGPLYGSARAPVFFAGDDAEAKSTVRDLITSLGFAAADAGALSGARTLEPLALFLIQQGFALGRGTQISPAFLERDA